MGQRGITLIEMTFVMAIIIGILASAAYPIIGNTSARNVDNVARELAADLQWMQQLSKNSVGGGPTIVFTTTSPCAYEIKVGSDALKPKVVLPSGVTIRSSSGNFLFQADGKCNASNIILQGGGVSRKIMVEENGRIHISAASS